LNLRSGRVSSTEEMTGAEPSTAALASAGVPSRRHAVLICVSALVVLLMAAGLCSAAILAHAPPAVVPLIAISCVGLPLLAACRLPVAVAALRAKSPPLSDLSLADLRRDLNQLPETKHPFGL
jgi:hypothetical protein